MVDLPGFDPGFDPGRSPMATCQAKRLQVKRPALWTSSTRSWDVQTTNLGGDRFSTFFNEPMNYKKNMATFRGK